MNSHPISSWIILRGLIDNPIEIEDDLILDLVDIMSQSFLNIDEEGPEEDILLDVVDLTSQIYWEQKPE